MNFDFKVSVYLKASF